MGRPLNKKFFGDGSGLLAVEVYTERAGASTAGYIVRQRSNLKYEVADETVTDVDVDNLVIGSTYEIVTPGTTDFVSAGAANNDAGTRFVATIALATGTGTAREIVIAKLQEAAATAAGQMRLEVTAENAQTPTTANIAFTSAGGTGALTSVQVDNVSAHYGYWADGTNVAIGGTTDGTVDYTVDGSGKIATVTINTAGSANTQADSPVALGDAAASNPPAQYARILNANQVKTFPRVGGSTFAWPTTAPLGGFRGRFSEADPDTQA